VLPMLDARHDLTLGGSVAAQLVGNQHTRHSPLLLQELDHPVAPPSPWQNGHAERLIGSIRRECLNQIVVLGDAPHLDA
jgi:Integrase core domain